LRLETNLSTQPPAPRQNARLSDSHENSGGAQCVAAPPSEEPSSLDSLKSSFDLSSFPQDFSAAAPKRVSAGLRRRAAPQRVTMHGLLPAQRLTAFTPGNHHATAPGGRGPAQSPTPAHSGSVPTESGQPSGGMGYSRQPARGGRQGLVPDSTTGIVAIVPAAASSSEVIGDRGQVTESRTRFGVRSFSMPRNLSSVTFARFIALGLIRFYQACISPAMPLSCRYCPSCSAYAYEAVEKWGLGRGVVLAARRLVSCRPWGRFGYDPVPEREGTGDRKQVVD